MLAWLRRLTHGRRPVADSDEWLASEVLGVQPDDWDRSRALSLSEEGTRLFNAGRLEEARAAFEESGRHLATPGTGGVGERCPAQLVQRPATSGGLE
jgi:hypothetical protein